MAKRTASKPSPTSSSAATRRDEVDKFFTPNVSRSVFLHGSIDQSLVYRLTPEILRVQHAGAPRDPITVYIDSPGGRVDMAARILRLLRGPGGDGEQYPLITVVTSLAASAAAGFLSAGDYAIAYPDSDIHFHGVRMYREDAITVEKASDVAKNLKASNNVAAVELARRCSRRFFFRFVTLRSEFSGYRRISPNATDRDCYVGILRSKLSPSGLSLIQRAESRMKRYNGLQGSMMKHKPFVRQIDAIVEGREQPQPQKPCD